MNDVVIPQHTVIKYVRNNKRVPQGVVVAVKQPNGDIVVDYSYCSGKRDRFVKSTALKIAIGRALAFRETESGNTTKELKKVMRKIPHKIYKELVGGFNKRLEKYYKTTVDNIITWT